MRISFYFIFSKYPRDYDNYNNMLFIKIL